SSARTPTAHRLLPRSISAIRRSPGPMRARCASSCPPGAASACATRTRRSSRPTRAPARQASTSPAPELGSAPALRVSCKLPRQLAHHLLVPPVGLPPARRAECLGAPDRLGEGPLGGRGARRDPDAPLAGDPFRFYLAGAVDHVRGNTARLSDLTQAVGVRAV